MAQKLLPYVHSDGVTWEHYFVDSKSSIIYFWKSHSGRKFKFSTKEKYPNGVKAKKYANAEFDRRTGRKFAGVRTVIQEELESWLLFKESEGLAYDTLNNVRRAKRQIEVFWGGLLPTEIDRDAFAKWCKWWSKNNPDIEMENAIKYFNNFCTYLHEKVINGRPLLPIKLWFSDPNIKRIKAKRARKKERVFTYEEFTKIHSTARDETEALVVHIMYTMATRIEETLHLDFGRIVLDEELPIYRWTVDSNKMEKIGSHALNSSLIAPMKAIRRLRKMQGTNLLFPQQNDNKQPLKSQQIDWDSWRERANLDWHWTPHTFRHTCLTNLFNDPKNPHAVIILLYRVSLKVALETYIKVTKESMIAMKDAIAVSL